jgi:hypothetical protein
MVKVIINILFYMHEGKIEEGHSLKTWVCPLVVEKHVHQT